MGVLYVAVGSSGLCASVDKQCQAGSNGVGYVELSVWILVLILNPQHHLHPPINAAIDLRNRHATAPGGNSLAHIISPHLSFPGAARRFLIIILSSLLGTIPTMEKTERYNVGGRLNPRRIQSELSYPAQYISL
ncbi:hypothetical protein BJY00DRAFT_93802 [Aspergillus carlsbadensis]|nr:hypothetical protein BJY00DRAFT_93802 [Aspergillus carlsbadensis]